MSSFLKYTVVAFFIFSTMYTLVYYINQGDSLAMTMEGLEDIDDTTPDTDNDSFWDGILSSITFDAVLDWISMFSPFILIKGAMWYITQSAPEIYTFINLIFLRPMGWSVVLFELDWGLNKLRGTQE